MGGEFTSGRFSFRAEGADSDLGLDEALDGDDFGLYLSKFGAVPDLAGAPVASWLLARIGRMTDDAPGVPLYGREWVDGGGWMTEFVVYIEPDQPVGAFQLQADVESAAVIGDRTANVQADEILDALASAIMSEPLGLARCELTVIDPEWKHDPAMYDPRPVRGTRNHYGWDGDHFLGRDNIRSAPRTGPKPPPTP